MAKTLTLKRIPDELYARLKAAAQAHRRSINSEVIVSLESLLMPVRIEPAERIAKARALRRALPTTGFDAGEIDRIKREGRA